MICHLCKENKLSEEFPFDPLTGNCDHPLLHCFQCATESVRNNQKCSQCDNKVDEKNEIYQEYLETLDFLFPNVFNAEEAAPDDSSASAPCSATLSNIVVATLSGERATLSYNPNTKIIDLKNKIETELQIPCDKQRLLYQNIELKTTNNYNELSKMKDYNVPPNSTLYLVILLYAVPEGLDHVIFDLYWGYPTTQTRRRDFLDASVFLYSGLEYLDVVNFRHRYSYQCPDAVTHSGYADMDNSKREGHQKINVSIKSIPANVDNLVFTLSAWNSPDVSCYRKPSVTFFDAKFPDKQLCSDAMRHVAYNQSIIMCSLSKKDGHWEAIGLKKPAPGNAKDYSPLKTEIRSVLGVQGYF